MKFTKYLKIRAFENSIGEGNWFDLGLSVARSPEPRDLSQNKSEDWRILNVDLLSFVNSLFYRTIFRTIFEVDWLMFFYHFIDKCFERSME